MGLVSTRLSLTHVCTIQRRGTGSADGRGRTTGAFADHLTSVPCRFWMADGREDVIEEGTVLASAQARLIVPAGTDVSEADRVVSITYRGGTVQDGPLEVRAVIWRTDHLELVLEKV